MPEKGTASLALAPAASRAASTSDRAGGEPETGPCRRPALDRAAPHADRFVARGSRCLGGVRCKFASGFELIYDCRTHPDDIQLNVHFTRGRISSDATTCVRPAGSPGGYRDSFGNWCTRIVARRAGRASAPDCGGARHRGPPSHRSQASSCSAGSAGGKRCSSCSAALLGSAFQTAWSLFGQAPTGWGACRRSATTCTGISSSATSTRA